MYQAGIERTTYLWQCNRNQTAYPNEDLQCNVDQHLLMFSARDFRMYRLWLSGRVLDSRPKGSGFEPHRRHCVVVLEQDTFILA